MLPSYSIAIRTLGTSGEKFIRELDSISKQTISPEKVIIYIAKGYKRPTYSIGIEEYVEVTKGMVAQRALDYDELSSEYILMLDDDVELAPNSAELLLKSAVENNADCVAADTFKCHKMSSQEKTYNIIVNLTIPHYSKKWAFKFMKNGSSSYNNNPQERFYLSQSAAGPAALWRKDSFLAMNYRDELWMEQLGFAYGDDAVIFNKLHKNGRRLGVLYNANIAHLDGKSSSSAYHSNLKKFYTRSLSSFIIWHRTCYNIDSNSLLEKLYTLFLFIIKSIWLIPVNLIASHRFRSINVIKYYIKGIIDGIKYIRSTEYKEIPNYIIHQ